MYYSDEFYFYEADYEYSLGYCDYWKWVWDPPSYYSDLYLDYVDGWYDAEYKDYYGY